MNTQRAILDPSAGFTTISEPCSQEIQTAVQLPRLFQQSNKYSKMSWIASEYYDIDFEECNVSWLRVVQEKTAHDSIISGTKAP